MRRPPMRTTRRYGSGGSQRLWSRASRTTPRGCAAHPRPRESSPHDNEAWHVVGNQTLPTASCLVPRMVTAPGMTSLGEKTLECDVELRVRFTCSVNVHACPMSRGRNGPAPNARSLSIMCAEYEKKPPRASEDPENPAARTVPGARDPPRLRPASHAHAPRLSLGAWGGATRVESEQDIYTGLSPWKPTPLLNTYSSD